MIAEGNQKKFCENNKDAVIKVPKIYEISPINYCFLKQTWLNELFSHYVKKIPIFQVVWFSLEGGGHPKHAEAI